jgi:hypothetical protein
MPDLIACATKNLFAAAAARGYPYHVRNSWRTVNPAPPFGNYGSSWEPRKFAHVLVAS